ncbi:MAG: hypothetical protein AAF772_21600 [Acidobacteriota bacterium]
MIAEARQNGAVGARRAVDVARVAQARGLGEQAVDGLVLGGRGRGDGEQDQQQRTTQRGARRMGRGAGEKRREKARVHGCRLVVVGSRPAA